MVQMPEFAEVADLLEITFLTSNLIGIVSIGSRYFLMVKSL